MRERERELTMSPMTAIRAEVAMGGSERLEEVELEGEGPERQHRVGACTNVLNIGSFFGFLLLARTRANNSVNYLRLIWCLHFE